MTKRPRYVLPGDKRSPMLRLLQDCQNTDGSVEVMYDAQWKTLIKAQHMGLVSDNYRITAAGMEWVSREAEREKARSRESQQ